MRKKEKWYVAAKKADFSAIAAKYGIDQVTARLIRNRGVIGMPAVQEYLHGTLSSLNDPKQMKGCQEAAELLVQKIQENKKIRIIGDYDIDGVSATYILYRALGTCGANVDYEIPDRMTDGYGLNRRLIEFAHNEQVDTILTCDNGIAAIDEIAYAKEMGMTVIVTDHHEPLFVSSAAISDTADTGAADSDTADTGEANTGTADIGAANSDTADTDTANGGAVNSGTADIGVASFDTADTDAAQDPAIRVPVPEEKRIYRLPPADVLVNPHQPGCLYPYKKLCGAAVAWKVVCVLYSLMGHTQKEADAFLEFAGFATVGDVMDLDGENRILVKEGLVRLRRTKNLGMNALIRANNLEPSALTSYHIGFVLGPCINASGRLETAKHSLRLLLSETREEAEQIAEELKKLNDERKALTEQALNEANTLIASDESYQKDRVLVVYIPDCHESIAGIVAGKLRERYYKPTFVITDSGEQAKGSGRSIETYSMFEEMVKCQDLFLKFGGHPMAAGFSLEKSRVPEMRRRLNETCTLTEDDLTEKVSIDVAMPINYISGKVIGELSLLEPFGKGNEKPLFADTSLYVVSARVIGRNKNTIKMRVQNRQGYGMDALYFGDPEPFQNYLREKYGETEVQNLFWGRSNRVRMDFTYYPSINEYMGRTSLQIIIKNYR
ncbi:MAG: DHHA1 domain-containing protein [Lachnospiraceae bacterium]|nr:DHHA1 domain-containing protein [Lachnospiraceae bacterium]